MQLYQFPISHFCEKVRWALDYKSIPWQACNLLPGPHAKTAKSLAVTHPSLPILRHNQRIIQGSGAILDYLEHVQPNPSLSPSDTRQASAAGEWERYFDREIGETLRCYAYHYLLADTATVRPLLMHGTPAGPTRWFYPLIFPRVAKMMRDMMNINHQSAEAAKQRLLAALQKLEQGLDDKAFLVGNQFTRADLTAAALLAPLCRAPGYGLPWPAQWPSALEEFRQQQSHRPWYAWVEGLYRHYRTPTAHS